MLRSLLIAVLLFCPTGVWASPLKGLDVYGSSQVSVETIRQKFGERLQACADAIEARTPNSHELFESLKRDIGKVGDFASVDISIITYYAPRPGQYLTVDLVDQQDRASRMDFLPEPTESLTDPDGLLAAWDSYQSLGFELMRDSKITGIREECGAFHCLFGYSAPDLAPFGAWFKARVPVRQSQLTAILAHDRVSQHRATAAFLLAHMADGGELVKLLLGALRDPAKEVRNNALRVLADIAQNHPEIDIPLAPIAHSLDYPSTLDRNKASAVIYGLSQRPNLTTAILRGTAPTLLRMLRLEQPNNHDYAYLILRRLSGQTYGERDYASWDQWVAQHTEKSSGEE